MRSSEDIVEEVEQNSIEPQIEDEEQPGFTLDYKRAHENLLYFRQHFSNLDSDCTKELRGIEIMLLTFKPVNKVQPKISSFLNSFFIFFLIFIISYSFYLFYYDYLNKFKKYNQKKN